jgi:pimeloyl-ACP methyl ester carboxylesterase
MPSLRALAVVLFVVALAGAACSQAEPARPASTPPAAQPLAGDWNGTLETPQGGVAIGITITPTGAITLSVPQQGLFDIPTDDARVTADTVAFAQHQIPGTPEFHGTYDAGKKSIGGTLSQAGKQLPLTLVPGRVPQPARPQEPKPPFPYTAEDVTFPSGTITIAGTLTLPAGQGPHPAVVLIDGSGSNDRNEEIAGHKPFLLLADTLTRAGYAVLRTDKRGVGGTGGILDNSDYTDLSDDILAGLSYLRGRGDIDPNRIGLLGHSEGGYLGPLVAARPGSGVAFVIMMAGPAAAGADVLLEQNRALLAAGKATREQTRDQMDYITTLTTLIRKGDIDQARQYAADHNASLPPDRQQPPAAIDQVATAYFDALVDYDPAPALSALRVPVLAFYGTKDLQVLATQNEPLARRYLAADPDADIHVFDGLNHLMQPAGTGLPGEYPAIETTIAPEVLDYITAWLTKRVPPAR